MRDQLIGLAEEAGEIGLAYFRNAGGAPGVEEKGHLDLVTLADREVEAFLFAGLQRLFPEDGICGEEGSSLNPDAPRQWVIDPIDGTFNFVRGMDPWAVSIGLYAQGSPAFGVIHAPARRETLSGGRDAEVLLNGKVVPPLPALDSRRGVIAVGFSTDTPVEKELAAIRFILEDMKMSYRHCGSTTAAFLMLAAGQVDACLGFGVRSWDVMAALPMIERLGGVSTIDWPSSDILQKFDYIAGSAEAVALARPILDRRPA
ncbi:inositol monophosphatase family protein [Kaistia terrae]|uniref:Inositol monophosphatase family protein n=1 Tax=Kaistia terrae TaxID=537017 RepID=A0ABW0Q2P8_9HYPH|nr:inositol monophosphatase [Kaistia terrae]MCX5581762.1 inositol monophosphatase [Kaistia terrae]